MSAPSSSPLVAQRLIGVVAEKGVLVTCNDAPSFEMLQRLNKDRYRQQFISKVFTASSSSSNDNRRVLFAKDIDGAEDEIQALLDPFRNIAKERKRERQISSSSDDDDDDDEDDN